MTTTPPRCYVAELEPFIGPTPREPGQSVARAYHARIVETLKAWPFGVDPQLRRMLMRRERQWRARAAGFDKRWNTLGGKAGRMPDWMRADLYPGEVAFADAPSAEFTKKTEEP